MTFGQYLGLILGKARSVMTGTANGRILSVTFTALLGVIGLFAATTPEMLPGVEPLVAQSDGDDPPTLSNARLEITGEMAEALIDLDPVTLEILSAAFDQLAASKNPIKHNAVRLFATGDRREALAVMESLALGQISDGAQSDAFQTLKQAGALALLIDPPAALQAYEAARNINDVDPTVLYHLGLLYQQKGNTEAAAEAFRAVLAIDRLAGTKWEAAAESNLGVLAIQQGNFDLAQYHVLKSLQYNERLQRPKGIALQHANLGVVALGVGNWDDAQVNLTMAKEEFLALGERRNAARALGNLGLMEQTRADQDAAVDYFEQAIEHFRAVQDEDNLAIQLGLVARSERIRGNNTQAEQYYKESVNLYRELGRERMVAAQYASLGGIEFDRNNLVAACNYWRLSAAIFERTQTPEGISQVQALLAQGDCAMGEDG